jgi:hypothetical protein
MVRDGHEFAKEASIMPSPSLVSTRYFGLKTGMPGVLVTLSAFRSVLRGLSRTELNWSFARRNFLTVSLLRR